MLASTKILTITLLAAVIAVVEIGGSPHLASTLNAVDQLVGGLQAALNPTSAPPLNLTALPVNCNLETSSPQFAWLCRGQDVVLSNLDVAAQNLLSNYNSLNLTSRIDLADRVCDGDCRCVMGANSGQCGARASDGQIFCMCDYVSPRTTPLDPETVVVCDLDYEGVLTETICPPPSSTVNSILNFVFQTTACISDCQCSHGYSGNNHYCMASPVVPSPTQGTPCVCNNGTNLARA